MPEKYFLISITDRLRGMFPESKGGPRNFIWRIDTGSIIIGNTVLDRRGEEIGARTYAFNASFFGQKNKSIKKAAEAMGISEADLKEKLDNSEKPIYYKTTTQK